MYNNYININTQYYSTINPLKIKIKEEGNNYNYITNIFSIQWKLDGKQ